MTIPDPGKGKPKGVAKALRLAAWKCPAQGDPDPDAPAKKLTKTKAAKLADAQRAARQVVWEATL